MSRKKDSKREFNQTLSHEEFEAILGKDYTELNRNQKNDVAFALFQFTKIFVENMNEK
jgi:hypothetical protein